MPGRGLPRAQAMEARGFADSFALKLRHHNEALHARHAPAEPAARACYDAVEAVRYEALGSNAYAGMRDNLDAALMVRMGADPITRAASPDEVPMQAALALLLRERLTGQPVPLPRGPGWTCCAAGSANGQRRFRRAGRPRWMIRRRSSRCRSTCSSTSN
jgi:cobaltochelatase CobT